MTLKLELTDASSNLYGYIQSYKALFPTDDNGAFNAVFGGGFQWWAGNSTKLPGTGTEQYSALMEMSRYSYSPGTFDGDVTKLALGNRLVQNTSNDLFSQNDQLTITQDGTGFLPNTTAFQQAIFALSHGGELDGGTWTFEIPGRPPVTMEFLGLTDYFAEQGTNQIGTVGADALLSFAGNDTLTGGTGVDQFVWNSDYYETVGVVSDANGVVLGWGDDVITDFVDGSERIVFEDFGWADFDAFEIAGGSISGNVITYADIVNGITSTITVNFAGTGVLDESDLLFV